VELGISGYYGDKSRSTRKGGTRRRKGRRKRKQRDRTHPFNLAILIITPNHLAMTDFPTNTIKCIIHCITFHLSFGISINLRIPIGVDVHIFTF
jgi:hypothetical protein